MNSTYETMWKQPYSNSDTIFQTTKQDIAPYANIRSGQTCTQSV